MSCCGARPTAVMTERHRVRLRYGGGRTVVVTGPATGTSYHFSGAERLQLVDPRDAVTLARDPRFRVDGVVQLAADEGAKG